MMKGITMDTSTTPIIRKYGWIKDAPDPRDHVLKLPPNRNMVGSDLRPLMPPVYDQGQTSSCTANAIGAAIEYDRKCQSLPDFVPSRLFIYYNERTMEGTVDQDAGAQIRDGIKSVATLGAPDENLWPFVPEQITVKPGDAVYAAAQKDLVMSYALVPQKLDHMLSVLTHRVPIVFGTMLFPEFEGQEVAQTGIVPMPDMNSEPIGGHAILIVGADVDNQQFIVRNSWGPYWGDQGYCYFPFDYILDPQLTSDLWCIWSVH